VASRKKPRSAVARRTGTTPGAFDAFVRETPELDIEPRLVALHVGALDEHLEQIAHIVNDRLNLVKVLEELLAASRLHVGDRVRLGHNLRPQYLHGRDATVLGRDGDFLCGR
jgi:hypothetical protein